MTLVACHKIIRAGTFGAFQKFAVDGIFRDA
jgi:hypothetical protein